MTSNERKAPIIPPKPTMAMGTGIPDSAEGRQHPREARNGRGGLYQTEPGVATISRNHRIRMNPPRLQTRAATRGTLE